MIGRILIASVAARLALGAGRFGWQYMPLAVYTFIHRKEDR